jgi:outer membrane biosynthesis protein TonB
MLNGICRSIQVGTSQLSASELAENIITVGNALLHVSLLSSSSSLNSNNNNQHPFFVQLDKVSGIEINKKRMLDKKNINIKKEEGEEEENVLFGEDEKKKDDEIKGEDSLDKKKKNKISKKEKKKKKEEEKEKEEKEEEEEKEILEEEKKDDDDDDDDDKKKKNETDNIKLPDDIPIKTMFLKTFNSPAVPLYENFSFTSQQKGNIKEVCLLVQK